MWIFVSYAGITRIRFEGLGNSIISVSAEKTQHPFCTVILIS